MTSREKTLNELERLSRLLVEGPKSELPQVLAQRQEALSSLAELKMEGDVRLEAILTAGQDGRKRLIAELSGIRAKVQELQQVRSGLSQLRPGPTRPPSVDVRL